jgi:IS5 family transposase
VKVEVVVERTGIPIGVATDAADVPETALAGPALADIPAGVAVPPGVPVVADRAYDSDPLRAELAGDGFTLIAPHRRNRKRPPTADGRRLRRYKRRWIVEKGQADCTSRWGWVGARRAGYHRRDGAARAGRVVPAAPRGSHRRSRMPVPTRHPAPPRA